MKKNTIITIVIVVAIIIILALVMRSPAKIATTDLGTDTTNSTDANSTTNPNTSNTVSTSTSASNSQTNTSQTISDQYGTATVIGHSVAGRPINAYTYLSTQAGSTGSKEILFVGGIHGGYEWNTVLVAYQLMNYLKANSSTIPANLRVTVIPVLNPDGLYEVVGTTTGNFSASNVSSDSTTVTAGRFNGNNVDLNRNFDCDWQTSGKWQSKTVSGGSAAFSEPESMAIKGYVETNKPVAVVVWYSAAGGVYASNCHDGVSADTKALMNNFARGSGYPASDNFDSYATTGDLTNWLAKIGTPAISVLLTNHTDTEWTRNLAGIKALLIYLMGQ